MTHAHACSCGCGHSACATHTVPERPRYYPGQVMTPLELSLQNDYIRDKLRRHNFFLHGWGVVCGLSVRPLVQPEGGVVPWKAVVQPGYALGPFGDEILLDAERVIDLRTAGVTGTCGEPVPEGADPWCSDVNVRRGGTVYVAIKFKEVQTRPVRAHAVGCDCESSRCEYSRWRDCYEIGLLDECPDPDDTYAAPAKDVPAPTVHLPADSTARSQAWQITWPGDVVLVDCPACPTDPWVPLARVTIDADGTPHIDNCACRRIVPSLARVVFRCATTGPTVDDVTVTPRADRAFDVVIAGSNFRGPVTVDLGPGIRPVTAMPEPGGTVRFRMVLPPSASAGPRQLTVINSDGAIARAREPITLEPPTTPPPQPPSPPPSSRPEPSGPRRRR